MGEMSRREWLKGAGAAWWWPRAVGADSCVGGGAGAAACAAGERRPALHERRGGGADSARAAEDRRPGTVALIFENCFPNTLDTTVFPGSYEGKPDTYVVTGDIDAMWLRDSSAQVWPYLPLAKEDAKLRQLLEGVIRRQARMILLDPYANAFMRDEKAAPLSWAVDDKTEHHAGVGERKWEVDSLCYTIRLAHGYWQRDRRYAAVRCAAGRKRRGPLCGHFAPSSARRDPGPYSFQRESAVPYDTVPLGGFGNPARPVGMIFSMFRPSDDACIYPLFVPANLFAVAEPAAVGGAGGAGAGRCETGGGGRGAGR